MTINWHAVLKARQQYPIHDQGNPTVKGGDRYGEEGQGQEVLKPSSGGLCRNVRSTLSKD